MAEPNRAGDVERPSRRDEDHLSRRDKLVAIGLASVLVVIVLAIFRLTLAALYGWTG